MPNRRTKTKELAADYVRQILNYDPDSGELTWKPRATFSIGWNTRWVDKPAGWSVRGHLHVQIDGANYYAHRLAWLHFHGVWPNEQIDHINGDRGDNRICNLRLATHQENNLNKGMQRNNTTGFIGVTWSDQRRKYEARIWRGKKCLWRKFFDDPQTAHDARQAVLSEFHGEFAKKIHQ